MVYLLAIIKINVISVITYSELLIYIIVTFYL